MYNDFIVNIITLKTFWFMIVFSVLLSFTRIALDRSSFKDEWKRRAILGVAWAVGYMLVFHFAPKEYQENSGGMIMLGFIVGAIWADEMFLKIKKYTFDKLPNGKGKQNLR